MSAAKHIILGLSIVALIASCKSDPFANPFDDPALDPPVDTSGQVNFDPNSFAGIHFNIFAKTCANSGCHDGTFEPDFRTIEASYNTLVYHPVIKNNPAGDFTFRVDPFNPTGSVLYERLINDIDGLSDTMPLVVDPGNDWYERKDVYIQNIVNWIQNGALDMFDNPPVIGNKEPQMLGVVAYLNSNLLPRNPGLGSILVPNGASSIDIWVAFSDDSTAVPSLQHNKYRIDTLRNNFGTLPDNSMTISGSPQVEDGYFGTPVSYYHHFIVNNPGSWGPVGTTVYFRTYVKDPQNPITEVPEDGSFNYIKEYFSFELE